MAKINSNFWQKLNKPFFILAPMDEVTDVVFRDIVAKVAKPDVFFTEFTNVEGLNSKGRGALLPRLKFTKNQHPIVAQIWGKTPENYFKVAGDLVEMGFDGIDINMGCPERNIVKQGCCSGLINNPKLASQIIKAVKKGTQGKIPVSVKTRIGVTGIKTEEWVSFLLTQDIDALTIHGRTQKEMSKVPAHWDEIKKAVEIRDKMGVKTLIIGNGDVEDREDGLKKVSQSGVDGIMIGRGIFKNIYAFSPETEGKSSKEMLQLLLTHAEEFDKTWGDKKNFLILRKFFKIYVNGFENAAELRSKLIQTNSLDEVKDLIGSNALL